MRQHFSLPFKTMEAKKHTAGEMLDRYIRDILPQKKKSHRKQVLQLRWWKEQIGSYLLADITPSLIGEQRSVSIAGQAYDLLIELEKKGGSIPTFYSQNCDCIDKMQFFKSRI